VETISALAPKIELVPHPFTARLFEDDGEKVIDEVIAEISSGNFSEGNDELRQLLGMLGLSSLWVFLKLIASFSGPYDELTDHLHVDMANFYQTSMYPGSKASCFIGRGHFKSTLFTHGANTWEIVRNPELHINLICGIDDKAMEFLHYTQETIAENAFFKWVYGNKNDPWGCYVPENTRSQRGWNDSTLTLPNKKRNVMHANITASSSGGATAGSHDDLLKLDDIISDVDLTSERFGGASMQRKANWLKSSIRTLVKSWRESRVFLSATRYGIDDGYEVPIFRNCKKQLGYWEDLTEEYSELPDGEWDIYYRMIKEDGRIIFPEAYTEEGLTKLEKEDPWTFWTQYYNHPFKSVFSELVQYKVHVCEIDYVPGAGYIIHYQLGRATIEVPLADCDVVIAIDPAASEKKKSAKTSRTAVTVLATAADGKRFLIRGFADYCSVTALMDVAFDFATLFRGMYRFLGLEMQGAFKVLGPIFREEQLKRRISLHMRPIKTAGDKDARIRSNLQPLLMSGNLYCVAGFMDKFIGELKLFPDGHLKDILDSLAMGVQESKIPKDRKSIARARERREKRLKDVNPITGM